MDSYQSSYKFNVLKECQLTNIHAILHVNTAYYIHCKGYYMKVYYSVYNIYIRPECHG